MPSDSCRAAPESCHSAPEAAAGPAAAVSQSTPDLSQGEQVPGRLIAAYEYAEAPDALRAAVPHCPELRQDRPFCASVKCRFRMDSNPLPVNSYSFKPDPL